MDKYKAFFKFVSQKLSDSDHMIKNAAEVMTEVKALVQFIETLGEEDEK